MASATQPIQFVYETTGKSAIRFFPEGTGQSYDAGMLVDLSSGVVIACVLSGAKIDTSTATVRILGIVLADATGTATTTPTVPVQVLHPGDIFRMSCYYSGNTALAVTAIADVGGFMEAVLVDRGASGYAPRYVHCADKSVLATSLSGDLCIKIVGIDPINATGAQYGYYLVTLGEGMSRLS